MAPEPGNPAGNPAESLILSGGKDMSGDRTSALEDRFLEQMRDMNSGSVVLDLTHVEKMDSRGVALCIGILKECQIRGLAFSLVAKPDTASFFKMLNLDRVMNIREV